jgi:hypothetical protein
VKAPPLTRPTRSLPCCASPRVVRAKQRCEPAGQQRILGSSELLPPTLNPLRQVFAFDSMWLPLSMGVGGIAVFESLVFIGGKRQDLTPKACGALSMGVGGIAVFEYLVFIRGKRQDLKIANSLTPKTCPRGQDVGSGMF